jgi:hypothetical protein
MQDRDSELRGPPLPRTWVNKGKKKGRGVANSRPEDRVGTLSLQTLPYLLGLLAIPLSPTLDVL